MEVLREMSPAYLIGLGFAGGMAVSILSAFIFTLWKEKLRGPHED